LGQVLPFLINLRSMKAETRTIPGGALAAERGQPEPKLAEAIRRQFAPFGGVDLDLPPLKFVDAAPSLPLAAAPVAAVRSP
jgi:hypothetical protein